MGNYPEKGFLRSLYGEKFVNWNYMERNVLLPSNVASPDLATLEGSSTLMIAELGIHKKNPKGIAR